MYVIIIILTMSETFKWIELLAVESRKNGLQIPVKFSFDLLLLESLLACSGSLFVDHAMLSFHFRW